MIERDAREFPDYWMDMNSTRVQSDIVQESRDQWEVEIRKLLHEVSRIAVRALEHARAAKAEGGSAAEAKLSRLKTIEEELRSMMVG